MSLYCKLSKEVWENDYLLPKIYFEICSRLLLFLVSIVNFSFVEMPINVISFSLAFSFLLYATSVSSSCKTACKTPWPSSFIVKINLWLFVKSLVGGGNIVLFGFRKWPLCTVNKIYYQRVLNKQKLKHI